MMRASLKCPAKDGQSDRVRVRQGEDGGEQDEEESKVMGVLEMD